MADVSKNKVVTKPLHRLEPAPLKRGKKKKFTPTTMRNNINKYLEQCEEKDDVPSIKGLMLFLKMYRETYYGYCRYPEFTDIMEQAKLIIAHWCETDVYTSKGLVAGKIAYMKNIHGWTEKTESVVEQRITTIDEARAKIEMLAPKLLELLKGNQTITNQLVVEGEAAPVKSERRI
jgi:hypothetical protein